MKQCAALFIAYMVFHSTGIVHADVLITPNDTNINYYGRFDFSNASTSVKFNWPGSIIEARFPGPSIGVELNDGGSSYFNVEIDGAFIDSLPPTTTTHRTITTSLSTANHTIRITLRTNGYSCSFGGFYLADGKALAAKPAQPTRKMEFIGDSWTAGDVTLQPAGGSFADLKCFNAALTYARQTSLAFHAQDKLIAWGGCGLVSSNSGAANMPTRYPKILCDGTANWDFTSWTADVVIIFLGINDFNSGVTDADFKTAYINFINTVRSHYANVPIILIGLKDAINGNIILTDVQAVAQSVATKVYTFSSPITTNNAQSLWSHPTPAQHRLIADSLIPVVKKATGWDTAAPEGIGAWNPPREARSAAANPAIMTTTRDEIVFPSNRFGMLKEIEVYNCHGRPLRTSVTRDQTVYLSKRFGLPPGMYIIKTTMP